MYTVSRISLIALLSAGVNLPGSTRAAVAIDTVAVGNVGNGPDTRYETPGYGGVDYVYHIAKYEVTAGQYTEFLNAVATTDTYALYNTTMWSSAHGCKIQRSGSPGSYSYSVAPGWATRPVNLVSWGDAARFANWLHNGQPTGPQGLNTTEDGSYFLDGATSDAALLAVIRNVNATWVLPSEDEWYKGAYHKNDGITDNYWDYPTGTNGTPSNQVITPDPGNNANFDWSIGGPYYRTEAGEFENSESCYGTFDQGGNVWEWNEAIVVGIYGPVRGLRGGSYYYEVGYLLASYRDLNHHGPTYESPNFGFRVAKIPERSPGDMNCDGAVDFNDVNPFVLAITSHAQYQQQYPNCDWMLADCNGDGYVDFDDINPFVALLSR
jgi:formylglycine-generating enzyme required for sulfatase activity